MPRKHRNNSVGQKPNFSVHDEIRRDRRIRRAGRMRRARSQAKTFVTVLMCVGVAILLALAIGISVTRVEMVLVSGNARYSVEEILTAVDAEGEILPLLGSNTVYKRIAEVCPYVESVELVKDYPSTLTVLISETEATYAINTRERTLTLDSKLRVMDYTDNVDGLILLQLPEIRSAVEGSEITFAEEDSAEYVSGMLEAFFGREEEQWLTELDITDRFDLTGKAGDDFDIVFGDYNDISEKLTMAKKLLADAQAEFAAGAVIDVSVLSQASLKLKY